MIPLWLASTSSPTPGAMIVNARPVLVPGLATTAPPPAIVTFTCLDHEPLAGVCATTVRHLLCRDGRLEAQCAHCCCQPPPSRTREGADEVCHAHSSLSRRWLDWRGVVLEL